MSSLAAGTDNPVRANPDYRLRSWESLPEAARVRLSLTGPPAEGNAVLVGRPGSLLPAKLVNASAARLFLSLEHRPRRVLDAIAEDQLIGLVLDSVLELELGSGWAGGPAAYEALFPEVTVPEPADRLGRMSYDAVRWAGALPALGAGALTGRLYGFGRIPLSQRWNRRYPQPSSVLALLDRVRLERHWHVAPVPVGRIDWLAFRRRGGPPPRAADLPYKLYVSPHPDALAEVLGVLPRALAGTPAAVFKLGSDAAGLLRPDKLVIYLRDAGELTVTAGELANALAGTPPHGVPFSAGLAGDGLLSWGGDPSPDEAPAGDRAESWRLSVCRRLADSLSAARQAPLRRLAPADFALGRLALDGVSLPSFVPAALTPPTPRAALRQPTAPAALTPGHGAARPDAGHDA